MTSKPGRVLVVLARTGFFVKGLLYMVVGWLAASTALGAGGRLTSSDGALLTVLRQPYGRVLLLVAAGGLLGYALWRFTQAIMDTDRDGTDWKGLAIRASYVIRGAAYALLGWESVRLYRGLRSEGDGQRDAVTTLFSLPLGEWLLVLIGLGLIGYAGYEGWRAYEARLPSDLDTRRLRSEAGAWAVTVSRFGLAARATVFLLIGATAIQAGVTGRASEMEGTEGALRILAHQPGEVGRWMLAAVSIGLMAYGFYQLVHARYLRMRDVG